MPPTRNSHIAYLDSVRGLAAFSVLCSHYIKAYDLPCRSALCYQMLKAQCLPIMPTPGGLG
ncbi:MAG: hypothetical protein RIQ52_1951 [Pseudomonadota bacterium]|jgi:peptidoglycan/LPS O-acetylase OafA/YrhL